MDDYSDIDAVPEDTPVEDISSGDAAPEALNDTGIDSAADNQMADQMQIQNAVDTLGSIPALDPQTWAGLDSGERLETLQEIEDRMAEIQGRPPVTVLTDDSLAANEYGGFNGEVITVNPAHLESGMPVDEFIDTIVHEGRHAYQEFAIETPGFVTDASLVNSWAENMPPDGTYLTAQEFGQELYQKQPVEADAWRYAGQIRNQLIAQNWR